MYGVGHGAISIGEDKEGGRVRAQSGGNRNTVTGAALVDDDSLVATGDVYPEETILLKVARCGTSSSEGESKEGLDHHTN